MNKKYTVTVEQKVDAILEFLRVRENAALQRLYGCDTRETMSKEQFLRLLVED